MGTYRPTTLALMVEYKSGAYFNEHIVESDEKLL